MHPGEALAKAYFEMNGYIVRTNVSYRVDRGWSDLDILAVHPMTGEKVYASVKSWHTSYATPAEFPYIIAAFDERAKKAVEQYLGSSWSEVKKLAIVSELGKQRGQELVSKLAEFHISVLETTKMLKEMVEFMLDDKNRYRDYDDPLLFMLRVLSLYRHLKQPEPQPSPPKT